MHCRFWIPREDLGLKVLQKEFASSPITRSLPKGYHSRVNYSKKSFSWLEWLRHCARVEGRDLDIQNALKGCGEYRVPGMRYSVDAYVPPDPQNPGLRVPRLLVSWLSHLLQESGVHADPQLQSDGVGIDGADASQRTAATRAGNESSLKDSICWTNWTFATA